MMTISTPSETLCALQDQPYKAFAVTREAWAPIIETEETFLADDEDDALEISCNSKEELMILIGDEVGVGGSQDRYEALVMAAMETVSITPVSIQTTPITQ